jgi:hypothetical protein
LFDGMPQKRGATRITLDAASLGQWISWIEPYTVVRVRNHLQHLRCSVGHPILVVAAFPAAAAVTFAQLQVTLC